MANTVQIKQINIDRVRAILKTRDSFTRIDLATTTGLSVATCGNILKDLLTTKEVLEIEHADSTGGRPSRRFVYNKDFSYVLSLYVRKDNGIETLVYSVSNLAGEMIQEQHTETKDLNIGIIDDSVSQLTQQYPNIKALSIGVPGVVNNGIIGICVFGSLSDKNVKTYFEGKYNIHVVVVNDVNCTAYGFYKREHYKEDDSLAYIYYPADDGPGAGIIVNNRILAGASNFAGEIAYLPHYLFQEKATDEHACVTPFEDSVSKNIMSINSVINPKTIVLSGLLFSEDITNEIKRLIDAFIPMPHIPEILFEPDIHDSYIYGLTTMALEKLTYSYKIIKK